MKMVNQQMKISLVLPFETFFSVMLESFALTSCSLWLTHLQGRRENSEVPRQKENDEENFQGLEINFGKLLLVYFMRPPRP